MSTTNTQLPTWFDRLPDEIIFLIFNYLSNNHIIYAFVSYSQRLKNLILQNEYHYLMDLELPGTNLDKWESILSVIGSRLKSLYINTVDLPFPLNIFPNVKSLIISLPFNYPNDALNIIVESKEFQNLHSVKIKENEHFSKRFYENYSTDHQYIFKKVFYAKNSLKTFQCSLMIPNNILINTKYFQTNINLHALTLVLNDFSHIFILIQYLPNLEYLDVQAKSSYESPRSVNKTNIKLRQFYLTIGLNQQTEFQTSFTPMEINNIIDGIEQFSSTLICLFLNFIGKNVETTNEIPFNSLKLQQFLKSMIKLEEFHLYARLPQALDTKESILSRFKTQYWFDHNLSFGMHGRYFYTLPFHFNYLYEFYQDFNSVKSNNPEILRSNPRIWYSVRSIQLLGSYNYNMNFLKQLKIKMPQLKCIEFHESSMLSERHRIDLFINKNQTKKIDFTLNTVISIAFFSRSIENRKEWLTNVLPNLNHLILSSVDLSSTDSQLTQILNKRIQYLDITSDVHLKNLTEKSYIYFSNIQHICINLSYAPFGNSELYAKFVMKILTNFQNLKTLAIYIISTSRYMSEPELYVLMKYLDINHIRKIYQVKYLQQYCLFIRERF